MNTSKPPFSDVRLRQALSLVVASADFVNRASYGGPPARSETFQSTAAMREALAVMKLAVRGKSIPTWRRARMSKGFRP